jgi:hypothetical protein
VSFYYCCLTDMLLFRILIVYYFSPTIPGKAIAWAFAGGCYYRAATHSYMQLSCEVFLLVPVRCDCILAFGFFSALHGASAHSRSIYD